MLRLRPFRQRQLPLTDRWFADADTQRWLGGPGWPGLILDLLKRPLGEYRGPVETGRYSWLAWDGDTAVGYVGCDYVVDPALRRQGYGTSIIAALMASSQITHVSLFVAGVEPANTGSISCLLKNGFQPLDPGTRLGRHGLLRRGKDLMAAADLDRWSRPRAYEGLRRAAEGNTVAALQGLQR